MACLTLQPYSYAAAVTGTGFDTTSHTALSMAVTALALPVPIKSARYSSSAASDFGGYPVPSSPTDSAYSSASSCPPSPTLESTPKQPTAALSVAEVRGRAVALARLRIASSRTPSPPPPVRKSVRFADDTELEEVAYTYSAEMYDRSIVPMATLNFRDFAELLQIRAGIRRQAEEVLCEAAMGRVAKGNVSAMRARGFYC